MSNDDVTTGIATLGASVEAPRADPLDDLLRGRQGQRRHHTKRTLVAITVTAIVTGGGFAVSSQLFDDAPRTNVAKDATPLKAASQAPAGPSAPAAVPADHVLAGFQNVLAAHLDPRWEHLVRQRRGNANQQGRGDENGLVGLGSKYGWRNPGSDGLGMLQLMVERRPEPGVGPCGIDPVDSCTPIKPPGHAATAWALTAGNSIGVVVRRKDGSQVTLIADPLFGNNSVVPLDSLDLDVDALLSAAADPKLVLPAQIEANSLLGSGTAPPGALR